MSGAARDAYVLGLDGGGSTFRLNVATVGGDDRVASVEVAGGDIGSLGAAGMASHLDGAVAAVCAAATIDRSEIATAAVGIPAYGTSAAWDRAIEEATRAALPATDVRIVNDVRLAREAAFASGPGVLALAGTGAMAWGRSEDGRQARVGGWGFAFGDEGGGYDLGRRGLAAASRAADGRGPDTVLLPAALGHFGVDAVGEIVRELLGDLSRLRRTTAAFAAEVLDAARSDAVASDLVDAAAMELARQVATARERLAEALPVSVAGGLFDHETYASAFDRACRVLDLPAPIDPLETPVRAAVRTARQRYRGQDPT